MRGYRFVREHLDDLVELVRSIVARRATTNPVEAAERDIAIVSLGERIEDRIGASWAAGFELPLDRVRTAFQLTPTEQRCLDIAIALAVSAPLRAEIGMLTVGQLDELVYSHPSVRDRFATELAPDGRLLAYGLLEMSAGTDSRFARPVSAADRIVDLALGLDRPAEVIQTPTATTLLVAPGQAELARRVLARHPDGPVLVVRGPEGSGRRSLVGQIARELDARLLVAHELRADTLGTRLRAIQREAILARAVVLLVEPDPAHASAIASAFASYPGPIAIALRADGDAAAFAGARGVAIAELARPGEQERVELWRRHVPDALARDAAMRYRVTAGQIARAVAVARSADDAPDLDGLHRGVRTVLDAGLSTLGVRLEWTQRWEDLVLPDDSRDELRELVGRLRHRRRVIDEWGFGAKVAKGLGITALFHGPPGTGKTMAAGLVAQELKLDLYQIDVSRLVSKYIGETEKNLAKVFEAAEAGHAVLLFDEADSLFAKRTEVKSSVDRYANLEVNYLLQRMESFAGITILTTNFESSLDEAFRRRLAYRIHFPVPQSEERARLWRAVIPRAALGDDVNFGVLAERFVMTGGYIRNAALRAAFLAAADDARIGMAHLLRAATAEYASMGKVMHGAMPGG